MPEDFFSKYARIMVYIALAFPAASMFFGVEANPIYYIISAVIGFILCEKYFIEKSKLKKTRRPEPGPPQPFPPPGSERWVSKEDRETGEFIPEKTHLPPRYRE